eukprot:gene26212-31666_t
MLRKFARRNLICQTSLVKSSICLQLKRQHTNVPLANLRNDKVPLSPFVSTEEIRFPTEEESDRLAQFVSDKYHLIAITGAGVSTASGIPDYRGPQGSYRQGHQPMKHQEFMQSADARKRYWMRSMMGFEKFSEAKPNPAHDALAQLELSCSLLRHVDGLHQRAGSINVVDLHGSINHVVCQSCRHIQHRHVLQETLVRLNKDLYDTLSSSMQQGKMRADGDADLGAIDYTKFVVPACQCCGGTLKPDVVFFGDNVPLSRVDNVYDLVDRSDGVLVVGTSLEVYSAYRFISRANSRNTPIAIVNYGQTRAERQQLPSVVYKSDAHCAMLLSRTLEKVMRR